jgi:hypothetical protein
VNVTFDPAAALVSLGSSVSRGAADACFGAASTTATGPALVGPYAPSTATWKWKVRGDAVVFFGTIRATETLPDAQFLVAGSEPSDFVELNVQVLARCTIAKRWTAPPAAGSFAGVAVKRLTVGVRTCRVIFGFVAATIGATDGGVWAAASAAKTGLAAIGTGPGVEPPGRTSASASSTPAVAAASARRIARRRRRVRTRPTASRLAGAVSVAIVVPRAGCIFNLICAEVHSDLSSHDTGAAPPHS